MNPPRRLEEMMPEGREKLEEGETQNLQEDFYEQREGPQSNFSSAWGNKTVCWVFGTMMFLEQMEISVIAGGVMV